MFPNSSLAIFPSTIDSGVTAGSSELLSKFMGDDIELANGVAEVSTCGEGPAGDVDRFDGGLRWLLWHVT